MAHRNREIFRDPKYDPPYPQSFHAFWPKHAVKAGLLISVIFLGMFLLSYYLGVPMDPIMPPMPDEGAYIPAPEWYLFLLFQPFWYLTGDNAKWLSLGTFWLPMLMLGFLILVPVIFRKREGPRVKRTTSVMVMLVLLMGTIWIVSMGAVVSSGAPAKTLGCPSCHNPMMGVRQALPPANMAEFYRVERQRQINLGGYNIGTEGHTGGSYKDANWQLRHFYEPTMTW
jgi:hypothetical protein